MEEFNRREELVENNKKLSRTIQNNQDKRCEWKPAYIAESYFRYFSEEDLLLLLLLLLLLTLLLLLLLDFKYYHFIKQYVWNYRK